MAQAKGALARLQLDFETTFGSDPASPNGINMPFNSCGVRSTRAQNQAQTLTGRRDPVEPFDGNIDVGGDIVVPVDAIAFGYWLKAMFGAPTTTGAGPYQHVFKIGNTQPSMVLEKGFADIAQYAKLNGCKVARLSMTIGGDGELTATLGVMGAKETLGTTSYDATPTTLTFARFQNSQAAFTEGGSALANGTELTIDVDFGLDGGVYVVGGGGIRGSIPEGVVAISGTLRTLFENATLLTKAMNSTESSITATLTNGTNILALALNEVKYARNVPSIDGPTGVYVELPFQAFYDNHAGNSAIVATLTNGQASYA